MDVGLKRRRRAALEIIREVLAIVRPEPMRQPMNLDRVKAFEIQQRLEMPVRRGIAIDGRHDVGPERLADRGIVLERIRIRLPDQLAGNIVAVEPVGDPMDHRGFERVVVENGSVNEGRELGLVAGHVFRLDADPFPDGVERLELAPGLLLPHGEIPLFEPEL